MKVARRQSEPLKQPRTSKTTLAKPSARDVIVTTDRLLDRIYLAHRHNRRLASGYLVVDATAPAKPSTRSGDLGGTVSVTKSGFGGADQTNPFDGTERAGAVFQSTNVPVKVEVSTTGNSNGADPATIGRFSMGPMMRVPIR